MNNYISLTTGDIYYGGSVECTPHGYDTLVYTKDDNFRGAYRGGFENGKNAEKG